MKFEFKDLEPSALVEKKRKYSNFKITPIGGPQELAAWKRIQEGKEAAYRMRLETRDNRIGSFEAETGQTLSKGTVTGRNWPEKQAFAKQERAALAKREKVVAKITSIESEKPTLWARMTRFMKEIWKTANF